MCEFSGHVGKGYREISPYRSSCREIILIISTKHVIFHSNVFKQVMSPVWMQVSLSGTAELAVTVTTSQVCHAATPPRWVHPRSSCHDLRDGWDPSIPKIFSISLGQPRSPGVTQWVSFPAQQLPWCLVQCWWVSCTVHPPDETGSVKWLHCLLCPTCSLEDKCSQPSCHVDLSLWRTQTCSQHGQHLP